MGSINAMEFRQTDPENVPLMRLRQPFRFHLVQIRAGNQRRGGGSFGADQPHAAGLNETPDRGRGAGCQAAALARHKRAVISNKHCAIGHQLKRQRRFAAAGFAADQHPPARERNTGGMQAKRLFHGSDRQADDEASTQGVRGQVCFGGADVLCPDHTAMGFDNLLGDREAEAGVIAEMFGGAL